MSLEDLPLSLNNQRISVEDNSEELKLSIGKDPLTTSRTPVLEVNSPAQNSFSSFSSVSLKTSNMICKPWRTMVSQNRRRYKIGNFDLDLTYITDRIIAMGFPAIDQEKIYRNSMEATVQFLEYYHAGHYMVFNLRGNHIYDPGYFHNRVMTFEMNDHHPPRLELMAPFCHAVHEYLQANDQNVVAVHCKAGKGRTGVMICAYLVYINFYLSPRQNMDYYSIVRTVNNKGVTIPSQRRYVYYFSHLRKRGLNYVPLLSELIGVYFERPPKFSGLLFKGAFCLRVANGRIDVFNPDPIYMSKKEMIDEDEIWKTHNCSFGSDYDECDNTEFGSNCISRRCYGWTVPGSKRVFLEGDVRVDLYVKKFVKSIGLSAGREKLGHVWFNTMFSCPNFCGGAYIHGDEAYPYPEKGTTIVNHWPRCSERRSSSQLSPSVCKRLNTVMDDFINDNQTAMGTCLNKCKSNLAQSSSSLISGEDLLPQSDIELPPGLDSHCPSHCLPLIYPEQLGRRPPRAEIIMMLRNAHINGLIKDSYNQRRLAANTDGVPVPKAKPGRPPSGGPFCLMQGSDEHVVTFNALEIDRAFKNEKIHSGFKIHIVLRCVDRNNIEEVSIAEKFLKRKQEFVQVNANKNDEVTKEKENGLNSSINFGSQKCTYEHEATRLQSSDNESSRNFFTNSFDSALVYPKNYRCPSRSSVKSVNDEISCKISGLELPAQSDMDSDDCYVAEDRKWLNDSSESED